MRVFGIIKWFGNYNLKTRSKNEHGLITCEDQQGEIYVSQKQVKCPIPALIPEVPVTFEIVRNNSSNRQEAIKLQLLSDETDLNTLKLCVESLDKRIWMPALVNYLVRFPLQESISVTISKLENITDFERNTFISFLPKYILIAPQARPIRDYLPLKQHFYLLIDLLSIENSSQEVEEVVLLTKTLDDLKSIRPDLIEEIVEILKKMRKNERYLFLSKLPEWLKEHEAVFEFLTATDKIRILVSKLEQQENVDNEIIIQEIAQILLNTNSRERPSLVSSLPEKIKQHETIFPLLTPSAQIDLAYSLLKTGSTLGWKQLKSHRRVLCVYQVVKEGENISNILSSLTSFYSSYIEENTFVRYVLKLLWARENPTRSQKAFETAHKLLQDYIVEQAFNSTEPLDLYPLLPNCRPEKVQYCEGKPWATEQDRQLESIKVSRAFCPRANSACNLFDINSTSLNSNLEGARLYAECSQDYRNWSLLELLEVTGVEPRLPSLNKPSEYVQKLSGWVNRLNEIRERLKCSTCSRIMTPNLRYSENIASYSMTVASCQQGKGHDENIYFNHCWACREIIDSRESKIRVENYYICIHCGSGRQNSLNYAQGDKCPKCGELRMIPIEGDERRLVCSNIRCRHKIKLPYAQHLTGSTSSINRTNRNNKDLPEVTDLDDF